MLKRVAMGAAMLAAIAGPHAVRAQSSTYTFLGDVQSDSRIAGGVLIRAQNGSVLIESVSDVGARNAQRSDRSLCSALRRHALLRARRTAHSARRMLSARS
jgi:hypothetical protein